jgi:hypothetical protein
LYILGSLEGHVVSDGIDEKVLQLTQSLVRVWLGVFFRGLVNGVWDWDSKLRFSSVRMTHQLNAMGVGRIELFKTRVCAFMSIYKYFKQHSST